MPFRYPDLKNHCLHHISYAGGCLTYRIADYLHPMLKYPGSFSWFVPGSGGIDKPICEVPAVGIDVDGSIDVLGEREASMLE